MKFFSHLNTATRLLQHYKGQQPFALFIKQYFNQHKKHGSKDRKNIAQLCYAYFRLGKALATVAIEERIITGLFLCSVEPNDLLEGLKPDWNEKASLSIEEKPAIGNWQLAGVFPWKDELSEGIDHEKFCKSFFTQPDMFLRLRPGNEAIVKQKLHQAGIVFKEMSNACLSLPNTSKAEAALELNKEAVIQDYNSQQIGELLQSAIKNQEPGIKTVWDCCAGSGGKSIMVYDLFPGIELIVSDIRPSILKNLEKRFAQAGINKYKSFIFNLTNPIDHLPAGQAGSLLTTHNLVLADVPCTGSGTWGRTPEQLAFFDEKEIDEFAQLQKKIVSNIIPYLQKGGYLLYITCSVFKKENEEVVQFIQEQSGLTLQKMELLKGYEQKADTLFAALFTA